MRYLSTREAREQFGFYKQFLNRWRNQAHPVLGKRLSYRQRGKALSYAADDLQKLHSIESKGPEFTDARGQWVNGPLATSRFNVGPKLLPTIRVPVGTPGQSVSARQLWTRTGGADVAREVWYYLESDLKAFVNGRSHAHDQWLDATAATIEYGTHQFRKARTGGTIETKAGRRIDKRGRSMPTTLYHRPSLEAALALPEVDRAQWVSSAIVERDYGVKSGTAVSWTTRGCPALDRTIIGKKFRVSCGNNQQRPRWHFLRADIQAALAARPPTSLPAAWMTNKDAAAQFGFTWQLYHWLEHGCDQFGGKKPISRLVFRAARDGRRLKHREWNRQCLERIAARIHLESSVSPTGESSGNGHADQSIEPRSTVEAGPSKGEPRSKWDKLLELDGKLIPPAGMPRAKFVVSQYNMRFANSKKWPRRATVALLRAARSYQRRVEAQNTT